MTATKISATGSQWRSSSDLEVGRIIDPFGDLHRMAPDPPGQHPEVVYRDGTVRSARSSDGAGRTTSNAGRIARPRSFRGAGNRVCVLTDDIKDEV